MFQIQNQEYIEIAERHVSKIEHMQSTRQETLIWICFRTGNIRFVSTQALDFVFRCFHSTTTTKSSVIDSVLFIKL